MKTPTVGDWMLSALIWMVALFIIFTIGGCGIKSSLTSDGLTFVWESSIPKIEQQVWVWTASKMAPGQTLVKPISHNGTKAWLTTLHRAQYATATSSPSNQVVGFYSRKNREVFYLTGDWGTLAHEYCHAINAQLGHTYGKQGEEYICDLVKADYLDQREIQMLRRELNQRKHRMPRRPR